MTQVIESRVVKRFKSFIMGKCRCGCNEDIPVRSGDYLQKYKKGHSKKRKDSNLWKNGFKTVHGYDFILKPKYYCATKSGYIRYHRWVYEQFYKCCLLPNIDLDHINHDTHDNTIMNLRPLSKDYHGYISAKIDTSGRFCLVCKSTETTKRKRKFCYTEKWSRHPITGEKWVCRKCCRKIRRKLGYNA